MKGPRTMTERSHNGVSRRQVLQMLAVLSISDTSASATTGTSKVDTATLKAATALNGHDFSDERLAAISAVLQPTLDFFQIVRDLAIADSVAPAFTFHPRETPR